MQRVCLYVCSGLFSSCSSSARIVFFTGPEVLFFVAHLNLTPVACVCMYQYVRDALFSCVFGSPPRCGDKIM